MHRETYSICEGYALYNTYPDLEKSSTLELKSGKWNL